jgi:peptide/nickel transport system permease protein
LASLTFSALRWPQRLALAWLALVVVVAALAPILPLPFSPSTPDLAHVAQPPFGPGRHWLGTDPQGRDVLSVLVFGARTAVLLTLPAAVLSSLLGALAGGAAGFWGNEARLPIPYWLLALGFAWWALGLPYPWFGLVVAAGGAGMAVAFRLCLRELPAWSLPLNTLVMGTATGLDTVPRLLLVVVLAAGAGVSITGLVAVLTLTAWSHPARLVRAQMLRVRVLSFVDAARAAGLPSLRIWLTHALPHAIQPLQTAFPLSVAGLLGLESTLSFLGIGLAPDVASWGRLLATVREEPGAWWAFIFPCTCLSITILSLTALARNRRRS